MALNDEDITENDDPVSLREWIAKHSDHLDVGIHALLAELAEVRADITVMRGQVKEIHEELEAAKPMIEKWQHSKIRKLANLADGKMPWQD